MTYVFGIESGFFDCAQDDRCRGSAMLTSSGVSFAPSELGFVSDGNRTACAVGCILSPLCGCARKRTMRRRVNVTSWRLPDWDLGTARVPLCAVCIQSRLHVTSSVDDFRESCGKRGCCDF